MEQKVVIVLDRSGSMNNGWQKTVDGLNLYINNLKAQKAEDGIETTINFYTFDDKFETFLEAVNIDDYTDTGYHQILPRGGTSLNDAVCKAITSTQSSFIGEEPNVTFIVVSDGGENSSKEYTSEDTKKMVAEYDAKDNWTFVMLGAEINAWSQAQSVGFSASGNTMTYDKADSMAAFSKLSTATSMYRSSGMTKSATFISDVDITGTVEEVK
jgi:uncharacterized protein YegL